MKKIFACILIFTMVFSLASPVFAANEVPASTIVANANRLVGKYPYVWGGKSPADGGFDCSGLVWYVYNQMSGVDISHDTIYNKDYKKVGKIIYGISNFKPGDIVKFKYAHVGIYIGDNTIIEAAKPGIKIRTRKINANSQVAYGVRLNAVTQGQKVLPGATIADGTYSIALKLNNNYALNVDKASTANNANLQIWEKNGSTAQSFKVTHVGDGYYTIVNTNSGKAVDVCGGNTVSGANVQQYAIDDSDAQLWKICKANDGSYYMINKGSNLYLDVDWAQSMNGSNVQICQKEDVAHAQKWNFEPVSN